MKYLPLLLLIVFFSCNQSVKKSTEPEWIQLFNGKNLSDWSIKFSGSELNKNYKNTFYVEDGLLKVSYNEYDEFNNEFGHIFYNKEKFSNYILRVEYRFVGEQVKNGPGWAIKNNGVMIHSQSAESMEFEQDFPVSIEVQLLGGYNEDERPTANLCTPGTHVTINNKLITNHCTSSTSKTYYGEEWVTVEIFVHGNRLIQHVVEGDTVLSYTNPIIGGSNLPENYPLPAGTPLSEGYISLQAESHPTEFRKVELMILPDQN